MMSWGKPFVERKDFIPELSSCFGNSSGVQRLSWFSTSMLPCTEIKQCSSWQGGTSRVWHVIAHESRGRRAHCVIVSNCQPSCQ